MNDDKKLLVTAIAGMGIVRFVFTAGGVPDSIVKYFSMTVIIFAGAIYFAIVSPARKERLKAAYILILPYMTIEVAALGYTWATGRHTIFHAPPYDFGVSIRAHTLGHLIGGLTWEPATVWILMEIIRLIYLGGRRVFGMRTPLGAG